LQGINEPRYLLQEPDAEAARYPQLFHHRLLAERPDWRDHARLLPPSGGQRLLAGAAGRADGRG
jgi:hypothetical protein